LLANVNAKDFVRSTWLRVEVGGVKRKVNLAELEAMSRLQYL
jgi:hypothetical protein